MKRAARLDQRLAKRGGPIEALRLPAWLFGCVTGLRGSLYDHGLLPSSKLSVPVISIGNLTTGGTGKTPFVLWLAGFLSKRGMRPGILSRGYKAEKTSGERANDEARMLARALPDVSHVQNPDRIAGGLELIQRGVDLIVLDDGFQHRRLRRDLDIVLVDALRPWGLASTQEGEAPVRAFLPRGLLRESPAVLARADAIVITRSDLVPPGALDALRAEIHRIAPGPPICIAAHRPVCLRELPSSRDQVGSSDERGTGAHPSALRGRDVDLVSAIGNPEGFEASVLSLGARIATHRRFPDHHGYVATDVEGLGGDGRLLVTTAKDAVKLEPLGVRAHVLEIELALLEGSGVLEALVDALPASHAQHRRRTLHEGLHG